MGEIICDNERKDMDLLYVGSNGMIRLILSLMLFILNMDAPYFDLIDLNLILKLSKKLKPISPSF